MIDSQIYSGMWIKLPYDVKQAIVAEFSIPRNGAVHVSDNMIISDGYLDRDLAILNVASLQKRLGSEETDLFKLWNEYIEVIKVKITPVPEVKAPEPAFVPLDGKIFVMSNPITQPTNVPNEEKTKEHSEKPKRAKSK